MAQTVAIKAVQSDWQSRGFSCDVWIDPPGQVWNDYRHTVDEVVMVLEGDVEFEIAGKIVRLAPGENCSFPPGRSIPRGTSAPPRLDGCMATTAPGLTLQEKG